MYHEIGIGKLSPTQVSRLLNGHGVRVKHGSHHKIHASTEQHKKIMTAHRKGKAHTLTFDPYQIAQHQHLRGHKSHGEGEGIHHIRRHVKHAVHKIHHGFGEGEGEGKVHTLPHYPIHPMGGSTYAHRVARRTRNTFKPLKELAHYAIPATLGTLAGMAGSAYGGPVGGIAGKMAGAYAGDKLSHALGVGEGVKRRGRPRKTHVVHHKSHGEGEGPKRRGRRSHGEALYPAGYGEGEGMIHHGFGEGARRGRRGRGEGEGEGMMYC